ncbi:hypothetical protein H2200_003501 [Cladophialophora chaetospira]|uniref:DUF7702 domain-containing protein n=1 Tax=Cladophialophora chaetospira TaxID=386627 RepID=A0AA38XHK6_9EURO|nr:hypothetical protein H2200_003501 [Cladophialophora chaetospira]
MYKKVRREHDIQDVYPLSLLSTVNNTPISSKTTSPAMTQFTYPDGVAVCKLIYYSPALIASLYVSSKHGFHRGSGWIFLTIFCIIRIIGAAAQLATIGKSNPHTAETVALLTAVLGLSPLLLATLGILARIYYSILKQPWSTMFSLVLLKAIQTPAAVALILCIVGATSASDPTKIESESTVHIGIILFAIVYVALVLLTLGAMLGRRRTGQGEMSLIVAVSFALPFLAVRVLYALLAAFSHNKSFNPATGSTTVALFMDVLQEMIVVLIYLVAAVKTPTAPAATNGEKSSAGQTLAYRAGRGDFGAGRSGLFSLAIAAGQALGHKKERGRTGKTQRSQRLHDDHQTHEYSLYDSRSPQTSAV